MSLKPMHDNPPSPGQLIAELVKNDEATQKLLKSILSRLEEMKGQSISETDIQNLLTKLAFSENVRHVAQESAEKAISKAYKAGVKSVGKHVQKSRNSALAAGIAFLSGLAAEAALLHFMS